MEYKYRIAEYYGGKCQVERAQKGWFKPWSPYGPLHPNYAEAVKHVDNLNSEKVKRYHSYPYDCSDSD